MGGAFFVAEGSRGRGVEGSGAQEPASKTREHAADAVCQARRSDQLVPGTIAELCLDHEIHGDLPHQKIAIAQNRHEDVWLGTAES
jgi:hypothetical protein